MMENKIMAHKNAVATTPDRTGQELAGHIDPDPGFFLALDSDSLKNQTRGPRRKGWFIVILFGITFFGWGSYAPIAGGATAPGLVAPDAGRKRIQHYEGGIVRRILVKEGESVKPNQPLLVLTSVESRAGHDDLLGQKLSLDIHMARLEAERENRKELVFSPQLVKASTDTSTIMDAQQRIFRARKKMFLFRHRVISEQVSQFTRDITGNRALLKSTKRQISLNSKVLVQKRRLYKRQLARLEDVLTLESRNAKLRGEAGRLVAEISRTGQKISEARIKQAVLEAERMDKVSLEIDKIRGQVATVTQRLKTSTDVLERTTIRAAVGGTVVGIKISTEGGVIRPGDTLMTIVPSNDRLLVEARISPMDIDIVHAGLTARIQFSAYSMRSAPMIDGTVLSISADSLVSQKGQDPYYLARVAVDSKQLAEKAPDIRLVPGMSANILIVTKERTMLEYLLEPIMVAIQRSMREV
jgi:HlyD family secretion protein/epimerase transport system membrane fusion protein